MGTALDCEITGEIYASPRAREIFDARQRLQAWLDAEVALAKAQAAVGLIPADAAEAIRRHADAEKFDLGELAAALDGGRRHLLLPTIKKLTELVGEPHGRYVHWGATTQDILDTGLSLQLKRVLPLIQIEFDGINDALARLAEQHKSVVMAARTHWQHALPMTLGFKFALLLDEGHRHAERLRSVKERCLVAQLGGGAGTLASLGGDWQEIRSRFAANLELVEPTTSWFVSRDRTAEIISTVGLLAAFVERVVLTIGRLSGSEIQEMSEQFAADQAGSSTMPQKRNPIYCERTAALCRLVRGFVPVAQEAMVAEHDRDMATYMAEWFLVPQVMVMATGAVEKARDILTNLRVDVGRIEQNLEITKGGIVAESAMFELAQHVGRGRAHDILLNATKESDVTGEPLATVLSRHEDAAQIAAEDIERALTPGNYIGNSVEITERVLAEHARVRASHQE